MGSFNYRALDAESKQREGTLTARDSAHLEQLLAQQGLTLIEAEGGGFSGFGDFGKMFQPSLNDKELLDFTYLIKLVVSSGIPILQGIDTLMKSNSNRRIGHAAQLVRQGIDSGLAMSDVMQSAPRLFPP
ncbi:MAG: hypothetical protein Q7V04_07145, partial [Deltaproteobacteria bacterium]|nr:hypothetical protein [Deltaproteobacteria bacterium]